MVVVSSSLILSHIKSIELGNRNATCTYEELVTGISFCVQEIRVYYSLII